MEEMDGSLVVLTGCAAFEFELSCARHAHDGKYCINVQNGGDRDIHWDTRNTEHDWTNRHEMYVYRLREEYMVVR
jgi:hypothetical protein